MSLGYINCLSQQPKYSMTYLKSEQLQKNRKGHDRTNVVRSLIMGGGWVKKQFTRSNPRKIFLHSMGHIFGPIFLNAQNVCPDNGSVKFDHGWSEVKRQVTRSNLCKILLTLLRTTFLAHFFKLVQNVCLDNNSMKLND